MKKPTNDIATDYKKSGKKMGVQPKAGESARKNLTVGRSSTSIQNGIYVPKPTAASKAPAPAKKSNYKSPTSKQTGMSKAMKRGNKGKMC
jgi:hypothetical protein